MSVLALNVYSFREMFISGLRSFYVRTSSLNSFLHKKWSTEGTNLSKAPKVFFLFKYKNRLRLGVNLMALLSS